MAAERAGAFHEEKRGKLIRLSESNSVAERAGAFYTSGDGVVFTAQPIALGALYRVELLEEERVLPSGLAVGVTTRRPKDHDPVPWNCGICCDSAKHWILCGDTVFHYKQERDMGQHFDLWKLQVGQTAGFVVTKDGELHFQINGKEGVGWASLPTDKPLWGFFDVFGTAKKVKLSVFAPVQEAVQPKPQAPQRAESASPRSKQPPSPVTNQANTEVIDDLMQENARLKQQIEREQADHRLQLDRAHEQLQQAQASHQHRVQQLSQQLELSNRQLLEATCTNRDLQQQLDHTSQTLAQLEASHQRSAQQLEQSNRQLLQANREVEQLRRAQQEAAAHDIEPWKVARAKVELGREIARGGWGSVSEGTVRVAIKQLHMAIANRRNIQRLRREMRILSQIRHPNLVQFIGAVFDEQAEELQAPPLIITELLDTNLRSAYERNRLSGDQKLSIFKDVAKALKYLHECHDPIIHRDVSAPNVLLEALPGGHWKGKLTDLGSANFANVAQTLAEGAIIYAAPETFPTAVANPDAPPPPQTFKIDVYSFGVMLCEVTTSRFPDQNEYGDMLTQVQRACPTMYSLIQSCTKAKQEDRPKMTDVLRLLDNIRALP